MINTFDFEYTTRNGKALVVEVDYYYEEPNLLSRESDWDYHGGLLIDGIRFYEGSTEVFEKDLNVTVAEIAFQFRKHMEELEAEYMMETNEPF